MEKLGHVRIDDRLIHGQIVASWVNVLRCNTIIVADDKAAGDDLQKMMLEMACPPNIKLAIKTVDQAAELLRSEYSDIRPGFYSDKRHWNSVLLDGDVPEAVLRDLCDRSYDLVFSKLTKKLQREIRGE